MDEGTNQGLVSYPGIVAWESFQMTDVSGIAPAVGVMQVYPQEGFPAQSGDIVLTYNETTITFANCVLDAASIQRDSGGQVVSCRFLDERWKWSFGQITGKYNFRLPNNFVDPNHEKTPQQLAALCFAAMGVSNFDASALPNDARPEVDWEAVNPAQELAKICDDLGCRIVPQRSTGAWIICVTGEGADLPDDLPYQDAGEGIDPKEFPDYLQIVTAPTQYQVALPLEAIGKETDLSWKVLKSLSYAPINTDATVGPFAPAAGFCFEPRQMGNISGVRVRQGDGTLISPRELAQQTVFKCWRINDFPFRYGRTGVNGDPAFWVDGYDGYVTRKQVILSDQLVQAWTDDRGGVHKRPSFMWGSFEGAICPNFPPNYKPGTRIDFQGAVYRVNPEERASFSLSLDPIDTDRSIITTSQQMRFITTYRRPGDIVNLQVYDTAKLFYTSAIQIRDPVTWQPIRYFRARQIGPGTDATTVMTVVKNDIQPWFINLYDNDGVFVSNTNNKDEVEAQCDYYLDSIQKTLETIGTITRTYIGLYSIDMDGAIQQVGYRIGKQGADTIASRGTEHDFDTPSYEARRQRDGRHNIAAKIQLQKEIAERRSALKGTFNT